MSVKVVDLSPSVILEATQRGSLFIRLALDDVHANAKPITPRDKGNLRKDVLKRVLGLTGTITWQKGYAGAQEAGVTRGHPIKHYTTPGTGKAYAERSVKQTILNTSEIARKARLT